MPSVRNLLGYTLMYTLTFCYSLFCRNLNSNMGFIVPFYFIYLDIYFCQNFQILKSVQLTVKTMESAGSHILMAYPVTALTQDTLEQHVKVSV